jgi:glycosyltransferase involved in cell wall biosynthesis
MYICYVSFCQIPSSEAKSIQAVKVCQETVKLGHKTTLIVPDTKTLLNEDLDSVWHHYSVRHPFDIRTLPAPIRSFSYYAFPRFLTAHLFAWQAVQYAQDSRADLVYTRHLPTAVLASQKGLPTVYEIHEINRSFRGKGKLTGLYLRLLHKGKGLRYYVILTQALKSDLLQEYPSVFRDAKMVVAPDGVDLEQFQDLPDPQTARSCLGLELGTSLVAGYAGSFYPGKGVELIYELACRCPQVMFLLMGSEPEKSVASFRHQVERDGLRNVILTGFIAQADLPLYLAACDVLMLPNQHVAVKSYFGDNFARWTSPMKLFEYMAAGRMIIGSDLPVLREVLNDDNALLCTAGDVERWQLALEAAQDKTRRQTLAYRAKQEVVQHAWSHRVALCLNGLT